MTPIPGVGVEVIVDSHSIEIEIQDAATVRRAWLAACMATPCPPLWAELATLALDRGWPRDGEETPSVITQILQISATLAGVSGAPAYPSIVVDERGTSLEYTTVTGTEISTTEAGIRVSGSDPASVVRRAVAAARSVGLSLDVSPELTEAALDACAARAMAEARSRLRSSLIEVRSGGRWGAPVETDTEEESVEVVRRYTAEPEDGEGVVGPIYESVGPDTEVG